MGSTGSSRGTPASRRRVSPGTKVILAEDGDLVRFDDQGGRVADKVPAGRILIDGTRTGEVGDEVLRDRRHLAGDGLVVPVVAISKQSGTLEETPDVITRGFVVDARTEALLKEIPAILAATHRSVERGRTDRSGVDQGKDPRGAAAFLPQAFGASTAGAAGHHGDLTWQDRRCPVASASSSASRCSRCRCCGSLRLRATARPIRSGSSTPGRTLRRRTSPAAIGAFLGELAFQLLGYAAYLIPLVLAVIGWHYFWCRVLDAAYTKVDRRRRCSSAASPRSSRSRSAA